jgi:hypothetical protein
MTASAGIIELLIGAGVGALAPTTMDPWPIFEGKFPDSEDQCLMVRDTGGPRPEVKIAIDYPSVQVLVRSGKMGYMAAAEKADEVKLVLHAIDSAPAAFPDLTSCLLTGEKTFVGYDAVERPVWSVNFNCILSKPPEGYRDQ